MTKEQLTHLKLILVSLRHLSFEVDVATRELTELVDAIKSEAADKAGLGDGKK